MTSTPPTIVAGRYRIDRQIGEGGMGTVYAAHDLHLDRPVALKQIRRETSDPAARERLKREGRIAAAINHPNVCQIHELVEDAEDVFVVMELLEGQPLTDRLRD